MDSEIEKIRKNKKIFDIQCESTKAALMRSDKECIDHLLMPIPKEAQCRDENGNVFLNERAITYEEAKIEHKIRYERGARLAEMRKEPDACSTTPEKLLSAVNAFMNIFSPERIKAKFKEIMKGVNQTYQEMVAEHMEKLKNER